MPYHGHVIKNYSLTTYLLLIITTCFARLMVYTALNKNSCHLEILIRGHRMIKILIINANKRNIIFRDFFLSL